MKKNFLSLIALFLSIFAIIASFIHILPTVTLTNESYISAIVSLLSIVIGLVIGYQIFNVIEWRNEINKLKDLRDELGDMKKESKETWERLERENTEIMADISNQAGLTCNATDDHLSALVNYLNSLRYLMNNQDAIMAKVPIRNMEHTMDLIASNPDNGGGSPRIVSCLHPKSEFEKHADSIRTKYNQNIVYLTYKERIDAILDQCQSMYYKIPD